MAMRYSKTRFRGAPRPITDSFIERAGRIGALEVKSSQAPLPRLLFEHANDRFARTSSLRPRSEVTKPYFAATVKKSDSHYSTVCFGDDAEIIFRRQPREKVPWGLVLEPFGQRVGVTVVVERAQFGDRAPQYPGCRLGVSWLGFAHRNRHMRRPTMTRSRSMSSSAATLGNTPQR